MLSPTDWARLTTPAYLFDAAAVRADVQALRAALGTGVVVSVKANPLPALQARCRPAWVDGVEIASLGEWQRLDAGLTPRYVNTPALEPALLDAALAGGATCVVDSPAQLSALIAAARRRAGAAPAALRLRLNLAALLGRQPRTDDHFGLDDEALAACGPLLAEAEDAVQVRGVHVFAGSSNFAALGCDLVRAVVRTVTVLRARLPLQQALIGPGLPPDWRETALDFGAYRDALRGLQALLEVQHEAGRAVFARAGRFVTRVLAHKRLHGRSLLVCDGGMAHCFALAQTKQPQKRWRMPHWLGADGRPPAAQGPVQRHQLVGNSCNRADVIGELCVPSTPAPGDLLVFDQCGAYHTYAPTGFLDLRPATLRVLDGPDAAAG